MAVAMFRLLGAILKTMVVANTFGMFSLLLVFLFGGFLIPRRKCVFFSKRSMPQWRINFSHHGQQVSTAFVFYKQSDAAVVWLKPFFSRTTFFLNRWTTVSYCALILMCTEKIKSWWIWGYWTSPMMYSNQAISVNEFLSTRWAGVSFCLHTQKKGFSKCDTFSMYSLVSSKIDTLFRDVMPSCQ